MGAAARWHRNQPIDDDEFVLAWTAYVWKQGRLLCCRYGLPEHHVEEYVSAGFAALASVPAANRWSSRYVMAAIRNRMLSAARRRQGEPHPAAMGTLDSLREMDGGESEDVLIGALGLRRAIEELPGVARRAVLMQAAGYTHREIARELGLEDVRELLAAARARLGAAIGYEPGDTIN